MIKITFYSSMLVLMVAFSCQHTHNKKESYFSDAAVKQVPQWSQEAIWYQIFVERFRNGDTLNDPTPWDIFGAYPEIIPKNWKITPWSHDWYKPDPWFAETGLEKFQDNLQLRRYGGDLQGVLDKIDYLVDLGVNAIYFNPLNDAPSLHKYDPRHWRHIDRNFGPDPKGDQALIASENPLDPSTWKFTQADSMFLKLIDTCHKNGIRVILDYSWNHTGMDFWALNDLKKNGIKSRYADWYDVYQFDDPSTLQDEFSYKGWYGIKYLPEIKKDIIGQDSVFPFKGNMHSNLVKQHIFNVAQRWLDPNSDGDPSDGVDGYRLDVAAEIPLDFWPEFRHNVRTINPEAYLVGEIWWQEWPDKLMNPKPFLNDSIFDAVMNYRWYRSARQFFARAEPAIGPQAFADSLQQLLAGINPEHNRVMMNVTASHDAPRLATSLFNKGMYKYNAKPYDDPDYKITKPDDETRARQKMLLIHQYTYIGAPHIWYGDEVGMWGADDPDTRKPMVWNDLNYDQETHHPFEKKREADEVKPDMELRAFIKGLIQFRKENPVLMTENFQIILANEASGILIYKRDSPKNKVWVVFNNSEQNQFIELAVPFNKIEQWTLEGNETIQIKNNKLKVTLEPLSASVYWLKN